MASNIKLPRKYLNCLGSKASPNFRQTPPPNGIQERRRKKFSTQSNIKRFNRIFFWRFKHPTPLIRFGIFWFFVLYTFWFLFFLFCYVYYCFAICCWFVRLQFTWWVGLKMCEWNSGCVHYLIYSSSNINPVNLFFDPTDMLQFQYYTPIKYNILSIFVFFN